MNKPKKKKKLDMGLKLLKPNTINKKKKESKLQQ